MLRQREDAKIEVHGCDIEGWSRRKNPQKIDHGHACRRLGPIAVQLAFVSERIHSYNLSQQWQAVSGSGKSMRPVSQPS